MWERVNNQDVGLEAATIERVRNSLLVESAPAPTMYGGSSQAPKRRNDKNLFVVSSQSSVVSREGGGRSREVKPPSFPTDYGLLNADYGFVVGRGASCDRTKP